MIRVPPSLTPFYRHQSSLGSGGAALIWIKRLRLRQGGAASGVQR
jgi:hypothetical protein